MITYSEYADHIRSDNDSRRDDDDDTGEALETCNIFRPEGTQQAEGRCGRIQDKWSGKNQNRRGYNRQGEK